jgi:hypothetical protein
LKAGSYLPWASGPAPTPRPTSTGATGKTGPWEYLGGGGTFKDNGSSFEIVNNEGASPVSGTFSGLPEGATFTVKVGSTTMTFKISYVGGSGSKNVVLTRIS